MAGTYSRLQLGAERMNQIMDILLRRTVTLSNIVQELGYDRRSACYYLAKLVDLGKIQRADPGYDRRYKHYELVAGAMPLVIPGRPVKPAPRKRGPKAGPRPARAKIDQQVKIAKATQIGIQRDPLTAALFGVTQQAKLAA